jgi:hypothetical protein
MNLSLVLPRSISPSRSTRSTWSSKPICNLFKHENWISGLECYHPVPSFKRWASALWTTVAYYILVYAPVLRSVELCNYLSDLVHCVVRYISSSLCLQTPAHPSSKEEQSAQVTLFRKQYTLLLGALDSWYYGRGPETGTWELPRLLTLNLATINMKKILHNIKIGCLY